MSIDMHITRTITMLEARFKQTFPEATPEIEIDEDNKIFRLRAGFQSKPGIYPHTAMQLYITILPQIRQVDMRFSRARTIKATFYENYVVGLTAKYDEYVKTWANKLTDLLGDVYIGCDPLDRLIKDFIGETDTYYELAGIDKSQREILWNKDMERLQSEQAEQIKAMKETETK